MRGKPKFSLLSLGSDWHRVIQGLGWTCSHCCDTAELATDGQGSISAWELREYPLFSLWLTWDQARLVLRCRPDKQHGVHLILSVSQTSGLFVFSLCAVKTLWIFSQKSIGYIFQSLSKPACTVWCICSRGWATIPMHSNYCLFLKAPARAGLASGASAEVGVKLQSWDVGVTLTMTPFHMGKVECLIIAQSPAFPSSLILGYQYLLDGAMENASLLCTGDEMDPL